MRPDGGKGWGRDLQILSPSKGTTIRELPFITLIPLSVPHFPICKMGLIRITTRESHIGGQNKLKMANHLVLELVIMIMILRANVYRASLTCPVLYMWYLI